MKLYIYTLLLGVVLLQPDPIKAQNLIAVQNGGTPVFFTKLDDAMISAQNGDTIYLSGGPHNVSGGILTINKELHFIGAGHNPDSTASTFMTKIFANIILVGGSSNSSFEGIYSNSPFYAGTAASNVDVDNIKISRCCCSGVYLSRLSSGWSVEENIIRGSLYGSITGVLPGSQNNYFANNIIEGTITDFGSNNLFSNNICLHYYYNYIYYWYSSAFDRIDGSVFENNVFLMGGIYMNNGVTSCLFNNNLFIYAFNVPDGSLGGNNIVNQAQSMIFVNQTGNSFSYSHDYHLKPDSPGKNAGRDGTDIGIYGGSFPWKEGSIPSNPHFQFVKIAPKTDSNGNLNVQIKVSAQDH